MSCEAPFHSVLQFSALAINFLVDQSDRVGEAIKAFFDPLDGRIEMTSGFDVRVRVLLTNRGDRRIDVTTRLGMRVCILLPDCVEQALQIFVSHEGILL